MDKICSKIFYEKRYEKYKTIYEKMNKEELDYEYATLKAHLFYFSGVGILVSMFVAVITNLFFAQFFMYIFTCLLIVLGFIMFFFSLDKLKISIIENLKENNMQARPNSKRDKSSKKEEKHYIKFHKKYDKIYNFYRSKSTRYINIERARLKRDSSFFVAIPLIMTFVGIFVALLYKNGIDLKDTKVIFVVVVIFALMGLGLKAIYIVSNNHYKLSALDDILEKRRR